MIADKNGLIFRANQEAGLLINMNYEHVPGRSLIEFLDSTQYENFKNSVSKLKETKAKNIQISLDFLNGCSYLFNISKMERLISSLELFQINGIEVTGFKRQIEEKTIAKLCSKCKMIID